MKIHETPFGLILEARGVDVFFGGRDSSLENLKMAFPNLKWARVRQTHSDIVLESPAEKTLDLTEADAHFSKSAGLGLLISTADCVPVLFYDPNHQTIAAIHAGWRGVASRIVPKTLKKVFPEGLTKDLQVFIGPHIQFDSFEIGSDVEAQLLSTVPNPPKDLLKPSGSGKNKLDLNRLVHLQLLEAGVKESQISDVQIDTKTDLRFHSHRRDQEKSGRQLSFIALK